MKSIEKNHSILPRIDKRWVIYYIWLFIQEQIFYIQSVKL